MTPAKPTHADIFEQLGEIKEMLEGIDGRVVKIEAKVLSWDRLTERAKGAAGVAAVALGVLWWMVKDKVSAFFGVRTS